jgi:hypothetical protein
MDLADEFIALSNGMEYRDAMKHLRETWLRLYLATRPYSKENIRQRAAICAKMRKWRTK